MRKFLIGMLCMASAAMLSGCGEKADVTPAESTVSVSETALISAKTPYGTFRLIPEIYEKNTAMLDRITEHGGDICALYADAMDDHPTEFEMMTAVALLWFCRRECNIVVLEVGMGGMLTF